MGNPEVQDAQAIFNTSHLPKPSHWTFILATRLGRGHDLEKVI